MAEAIRKVLEEVRRLDAEATPAPWDPEERGNDTWHSHLMTNDAALIARYRTLAPRLAAALEVAVSDLEVNAIEGQWVRDLLARIAAALTAQGEGGDA